jgi:hypothetical protein
MTSSLRCRLPAAGSKELIETHGAVEAASYCTFALLLVTVAFWTVNSAAGVQGSASSLASIGLMREDMFEDLLDAP